MIGLVNVCYSYFVIVIMIFSIIIIIICHDTLGDSYLNVFQGYDALTDSHILHAYLPTLWVQIY